MERPTKVLVIFVLGLFMSAAVGFGQSATGGVNGTVTDETGGVIPGVTLTLTNQGTGIAASAATNASGVYAFVNIVPGSYTLKAEKPGFKTASVAAFQMNVNRTVTQEITLSVGQVTQTVEVKGEAPLLQASTSELGTVVGEQAIERLPMNGRNFTQMLLLTPGVTPIDTSQEWGSTVALPGSTWVKPSVNGQWDRSDVFLMDGVINLEGETSGYGLLPSLDAIEEFKVQTHNDKGEYGLVMGGTVNLATKSGTNALHGSAFEFLRNELFNARNPFTDIVPVNEENPAEGLKGPAVFRQNQFGATLGGPVYLPKFYNGKDKTFFFFSYDGWRYRLAEKALYRVPTAAELGGNFSDWPTGPGIAPIMIYDPATTRPDPMNPGQFIRDPFPGNIIPPNRVDTMMVHNMQTLYDTPNIALGYNNVVNNRAVQNDANGFQVRIDHQISPKANLFFRYNHFKDSDLTPDTLKNGGTDIHTDQQAAVGWNQLFGPAVALNTRFAFSTVPWVRDPEHPYTAQQWTNLGWPQIGRFGGQVNLGIDGMGSTGIEGDPNSVVWQRHYQLSQDLSWIKGNHQLKFGWLMFRQSWGGTDPYVGASFGVNQTANPEETGGVVSGLGLASALLGLPQNAFGALETYDQRYYTWGFYGQDEWKVTRNLTLDYSLRWEFVDPAQYYQVTAGDFDISTGNWWIGGKAIPGPCSTVGAAPCIPADTLADIPGGDHIVLAPRPNIKGPHRKNLEPRVGLAWQFAPKTVLRVGAGMPYDVFSGITQENNNIQAAWPNANYANATYNLLGQALTTIEAAEGTKISPLPDATPWYGMDYKFDPGKKPPYSVQYNVQLQRQFTENLTGSVAYSGSVSRRLDYGYPVNAATTPGSGDSDQVNALRPYLYIPTAFYYSLSIGRASYNSLQVELNRRFARGAMLLVAYTWSKTMDNGNSGWFGSENGPSGSSSLQNTYDLNSNRSVAAYDIPHNFWVSGTWEPPVGKGKKMLQSGPLSWVLGNWRTDFIQSMRSGQPWNPMISGDLANVGRNDTYMRPNLIGNPNPPNRTANMWVNPAAFGIPQFAYGNVGRNSFRSKSVFDTDLAIVKEIHMGERTTLQIRGESFNIFNIQNYGPPNADVSQSNFGSISSLAANQYPRQLQFALRLTF